MTKQALQHTSDYYTVTEVPLTEADKRKMKKGSALATIAWILIGLFFIWVATAKVSYWILSLVCGFLCFIIPVYHSLSTRKSMTNDKIIFTGKITNKIKGEEVLVYFGPEGFDITYAKNVSEIETGDLVSLHYAQKENGEKGLLLNIQK